MENLQMRNFRIVGAPVIKKDAKEQKESYLRQQFYQL